MPKSVYIHIPFCKSKCHYCSFVSFPKLELKEQYLAKLEEEIKANYEGEELNSIYFGGGTPSLLSVSEFKRLIKFFNVTKNTEITIELNPEGVNEGYLAGLKSCGVNRLSLGCQTFNDKILEQINRRHNSFQVVSAVKIIQNAGFDNMSLDFIYGLPNQTEQMFLEDLSCAVNLGIQHISLYGLSIENGCYFYSNVPKNLPDDDMQADMYLSAVEFLTSKGFEHYEISNFCLKGFYSMHNLNYWNNEEYYGFGAAAHGYKNGIRYCNTNSLEHYIEKPLLHEKEHIETEQEKLEEEIFLGFRRMKEGVNLQSINRKFSIDFENKYKVILDKYCNLNLLKKTSKGYALTTKGALLSNTVLMEFISVL